jgi:tripartite-type tricarboxylate transporter receptor subunit TctC
MCAVPIGLASWPGIQANTIGVSVCQSNRVQRTMQFEAKFNGVLAPRNTPKAVVDKLSAAIQKALLTKDAQEKFAALGSKAQGSTPEEFNAFLTNETRKWGDLLKTMKTKK